ncbi:MAG: AAA family ATPase [Acidobacteriia bacterium]|nr:AAA family ATPase [Terriglobia bacterium]
MPRAGLAPKDLCSEFGEMISNVERYLRRHAIGDTDSAFANATTHGLFVGVGDSKFMFSPYHGGLPGADALTHSGLYTFEELKALNMQKPEPVIEALVFGGETILIAGRPKVGKSRIVHQAALAIVRGTEFLGMKVPRARRVLVVDLENRPWAIRDRLVRMVGDEASAPGLFLWCANSLTADALNATPEGIGKLRSLIEQTGAEVVIIDPWRLWLGGDENSAEDVVRGLRSLSGLRESRPNLTIIIVHHVRKDRFESPRNLLADPRLWIESVSGHYALASHVDACFGLERQRDNDGEEWIAFGGIARNTEPRTILLEDEEDTLRFEVRQGEAVLEAILTMKEREIWKAATKLKRVFGFNELINHAGVTNRKAASSMLKKAESHGLITRSEKGYAVTKTSG